MSEKSVDNSNLPYQPFRPIASKKTQPKSESNLGNF